MAHRKQTVLFPIFYIENRLFDVSLFPHRKQAVLFLIFFHTENRLFYFSFFFTQKTGCSPFFPHIKQAVLFLIFSTQKTGCSPFFPNRKQAVVILLCSHRQQAVIFLPFFEHRIQAALILSFLFTQKTSCYISQFFLFIFLTQNTGCFNSLLFFHTENRLLYFSLSLHTKKKKEKKKEADLLVPEVAQCGQGCSGRLAASLRVNSHSDDSPAIHL